MSWLRERRRRKREAETLEEALARVMRAEIVINLGGGALLAPSDHHTSREGARKAIEEMIRVARCDDSPATAKGETRG